MILTGNYRRVESSNEIWPNPRWNDPQCFSWRSYCIRKYPFLQFRYAKLFEEGLDHLAEQFHSTATISFRYNDGYPAVINHRGLYAALLDSNKLHELDAPVLQAEDFGIYTQQYPCVFFFLGVGDTPALHDPTFDFDMDVLENGVEWYKTILFTENLLVKNR